jgi:hypothetical protein
VELKQMEIEILKKEWTGTAGDSNLNLKKLAAFELMDGTPGTGTRSLFLYSGWQVNASLYGYFWQI